MPLDVSTLDVKMHWSFLLCGSYGPIRRRQSWFRLKTLTYRAVTIARLIERPPAEHANADRVVTAGLVSWGVDLARLGHVSIQHTVVYTQLAPARFKDFWRD